MNHASPIICHRLFGLLKGSLSGATPIKVVRASIFRFLNFLNMAFYRSTTFLICVLEHGWMFLKINAIRLILHFGKEKKREHFGRAPGAGGGRVGISNVPRLHVSILAIRSI